jgi:hypothetical protein
MSGTNNTVSEQNERTKECDTGFPACADARSDNSRPNSAGAGNSETPTAGNAESQAGKPVSLSLLTTNTSAPAEKIAIFRSLFRGREDVYPRRFESRKTGRAGYSPACGNEWVRGVCEKPRIKCSDCPHQAWLPVTDEVVRAHLTGADERGLPFVMGVYPMLRDERCWFLAVDFDSDAWAADALAYLGTCEQLGVAAALERSRLGNGALQKAFPVSGLGSQLFE